jgi:uncharacterized protein
MEFEWDDHKAEINLKKHGVAFSEAASVWLDSSALEIADPEHSDTEDRWIRLGLSRTARVLVVVFIEKTESDRIRIVSARKASRFENKQYNRSR